MRAFLLGLGALLVLGAPADAKPVRVATLLPYVEDSLVRLGDGVEVVATVRRHPTQAPPAPRLDLGSPHGPSFERLAEAHPDVIVGDAVIHGPLKDKLAGIAKNVVLVRGDSVESTLAGLLDVGRQVGAGDRMTALVEATRKDLAALAVTSATPTLVVFGVPGSFLVVSSASWIGDLVGRLGLDNVAARATGVERHPGYVQLGDETLATLRPELVLLVAHGDPVAVREALLQRLGPGGPLAAVGAAATRGVHVLPPPLFTANPGLDLPRAAQALRDLAVGTKHAKNIVGNDP
jgi:iron complex transport system substrate-binding protein